MRWRWVGGSGRLEYEGSKGRGRDWRAKGESVGYLGNLQLVSLVRPWSIIGQCFGSDELVVGGWGGDDVALTGNLAGEAGDGTGHCRRDS